MLCIQVVRGKRQTEEKELYAEEWGFGGCFITHGVLRTKGLGMNFVAVGVGSLCHLDYLEQGGDIMCNSVYTSQNREHTE